MLRSQVFEQGRRSIEEIHFYFKLETPQGTANAVMASSFSDPDAELLDNSYQTYWTAHRTDILRVFDIHSIESVVMMAPDPNTDGFYMMQRPGLNVCSTMLGEVESDSM